MNKMMSTDSIEARLPEGFFDLIEQRMSWEGDAESLFLPIFADGEAAFWLDSNMLVPGLSRYSFMGGLMGPHSRLLAYDVHDESLSISGKGGDKTRNMRVNLLRFLSSSMGRISVTVPTGFNLPFAGGFCGYFGYELKQQTCRTPAFRAKNPDASLLFVDRFIAIDHEEGCISICALALKSDVKDRQDAQRWIAEMCTSIAALNPVEGSQTENSCTPCRNSPVFNLRDERTSYINKIEQSQALIDAGETYEVCLTNQIATRADVEPIEIYRVLRRTNPAPYSAFLKFGDLAVSCSSPERFLKVDHNGVAESKPIKGTARRGSDDATDMAITHALASDEKSRSENLMIVDLLRNDLGRVCRTGSVHVPKLMQVETYETVHQMVSTVRGELAEGLSAVDCIQACFPGGSMTGAPKIRTLDIIDQLEGIARGIYSGSIGFLSLCGQCDLNIVIRTIISEGSYHSIGCGGAIVALSDPEEEFEEILLKARAPMSAIVKAVTGADTSDFKWGTSATSDFNSLTGHLIRLARTEDISDIVDAVDRLLITLGGRPTFFNPVKATHACRDILNDPENGFVVLAEDDTGQIVGLLSVSSCCAIRSSKPYGIIQEAWIEDSIRGKTLGRDVMQFALEAAHAKGFDLVEVSIPGTQHPEHDRIRNFYEKFEFVSAGLRMRWQAEGHF